MRVDTVAPGMSGARIFCCRNELGNRFALKRWPTGSDRERIDKVHHVMCQSRNNHCQLVPEVLQTCLQSNRYCWDFVQWMPGKPLDADASLDSIQRGAAAIARFHASTTALGQRIQVVPGVIERLNRIRELGPMMGSLLNTTAIGRLQAPLAEAVHRAAQLLRFKWDQAIPQITRSLLVFAQQPVMTQYVLRDVHREHVLFNDGRPSGLIDFDAVRVDSKAIDFARWVGSFQKYYEDPDAAWHAVLAGVQDNCPSKEGLFVETDLALAKALAGSNPWISLANWLDWLLVDQRRFPAGPDAVTRRIIELTDAASQVAWVE